jgi:hypothetical protein
MKIAAAVPQDRHIPSWTGRAAENQVAVIAESFLIHGGVMCECYVELYSVTRGDWKRIAGEGSISMYI